MKNLITLFSLAALLFTYGCNEKISPELQDGNSTTVGSTAIPDEYYFKVTNKSPLMLNYVLHRTGPGHHSTECKISSTAPVSLENDLYRGEASEDHDDKDYDMSCFFEAEELSLFFNGLSFSVEASKNTCEYVAYSPFSYFNSLPGKTTANFAIVTCDEGMEGYASGLTGSLISGGLNCNQMVDQSIPIADRVALDVPDDLQRVCQFDYETQDSFSRQNCDEGRPRYRIYNVIDVDPNVDNVVSGLSLSELFIHECGGSINACVGGPIKDMGFESQGTRGFEIMNTDADTNFSKTYELGRLGESRAGNFEIVNFRKGLANPNIPYVNYSSANEANWDDDPDALKAFDPNLMEKYAANKTFSNATIINTGSALYTTASISGGVSKEFHAAEPYLGLNGSRVNPFYTFYCLDRAFEIKARIRMVVRDWDRVFTPGQSYLEEITDSYKSALNRRMDLPNSEQEMPNDPALFNYFNDVWDWDNFLEMTRVDADDFSPTDGWFDPFIFPNLEDQ